MPTDSDAALHQYATHSNSDVFVDVRQLILSLHVRKMMHFGAKLRKLIGRCGTSKSAVEHSKVWLRPNFTSVDWFD